MSSIPEHIDELIARSLAGEADAQQLAQLDQWKQAEPTHQKYYEQCALIFKSHAEADTSDFNVDTAWEKLHQKIKDENVRELHVPAVKTEFSLVLRIAAVLLLVAGISWWLSSNYGTKEQINISAGNNVLHDTLPDGSTLSLNRKSTLAYTADYGKKNRKIKLQGEAYFTVKHLEKLPFIVEANGIFIEDIGTAFNVKASGDSSFVEVMVEEGEVHFYTEGSEGIRLTKGQGAVYKKSTGQITRFDIHQPGMTAYRNGRLDFNNTKLSDVASAVGRLYGITVIADKELEDCLLTVTFENEELETVLSVICETLGLTYERSDTRILLKGSGCKN